jgi:hypothetical protein
MSTTQGPVEEKCLGWTTSGDPCELGALHRACLRGAEALQVSASTLSISVSPHHFFSGVWMLRHC